MSIEVGDWVQYKAEWTKHKDLRIEVVTAKKILGELAMYMTSDGFLIFDHHILEVRKAAKP